MIRYSHTQIGWWIPLVILPISAFLMIMVAMEDDTPGAVAILALLPLVISSLFYRLCVTVDDSYLRVVFGIGVIRFKWALTDIKSCKQVRNQFWYGWGIRWYPGGLLFNVTGLDAVEIILSSGKKRRIGTDEPIALDAAIMAGTGQTGRAYVS